MMSETGQKKIWGSTEFLVHPFAHCMIESLVIQNLIDFVLYVTVSEYLKRGNDSHIINNISSAGK